MSVSRRQGIAAGLQVHRVAERVSCPCYRCARRAGRRASSIRRDLGKVGGVSVPCHMRGILAQHVVCR
jgi:hypothetical protein